MAESYHLEAEYESGYIHSNQHGDISPYALGTDGKLGPNILNDIITGRPETVHGKLVRLSFFKGDKRHNIDWRTLPDTTRPIYFRVMQLVRNVSTGEQETTVLSHSFGYQYTDEDGKNHQEVKEI